MDSLTVINRVAVAVYLATGPILTGLIYEHALDSGLAVIIAGGITTLGTAFHLGQAAVPLGSTSKAEPAPESPTVTQGH